MSKPFYSKLKVVIGAFRLYTHINESQKEKTKKNVKYYIVNYNEYTNTGIIGFLFHRNNLVFIH